MFTSTVPLLLLFWKETIDYASEEYCNIKLATEMVNLTAKR